jgi:hypothetical protein
LVSQIYYKILDIFNITNISKKQFSLALVAVVFATALIASALVVDSVDAKKAKVTDKLSHKAVIKINTHQ